MYSCNSQNNIVAIECDLFTGIKICYSREWLNISLMDNEFMAYRFEEKIKNICFYIKLAELANSTHTFTEKEHFIGITAPHQEFSHAKSGEYHITLYRCKIMDDGFLVAVKSDELWTLTFELSNESPQVSTRLLFIIGNSNVYMFNSTRLEVLYLSQAKSVTYVCDGVDLKVGDRWTRSSSDLLHRFSVSIGYAIIAVY